jgi:hypothetical protein
MAKLGAVEVGFNEETLDAIRTLQRTVDRFTPESGGGFAEVATDHWSDGHFCQTHIGSEDIEDGYMRFVVSIDDDHIPVIIRESQIADELIGMLIHWRRRAFGHE